MKTSVNKIVRSLLWVAAICFVYMLFSSLGRENYLSAFIALAGVVSIVMYLLATTEME